LKPDQPLFLARKLESLAKWFEPNDYQKQAGRMRFLIATTDAEQAVALLKEACEQMERYQRLLASTAKAAPVGKPRGPRPKVTAEEMAE